MAQLSLSEDDWNDRVRLFNYHCRGCRNPIVFADQELYFVQGFCQACFEGLNERRFGPDSDTGKRLAKIRSRWGEKR